MNPGPGFIRFIVGLVILMGAAGADEGASISSILFFAFFGIMFMHSGIEAMKKAASE